ncbi:MAG: ribosome silencing factor [Candidatus Schekmanbacteria bacterium]|nr:ribosome silencing factor [Candidatus Schekmanbacteria bacterium]
MREVKEKKKSESKKEVKAISPKKLTPRQMALKAAEFADDKKALDIIIFDVRKLTTVTDFFCICHGTSDRHAKTIAEDIIEQFKKNGHIPLASEGFSTCQWIVVDFADIVVHVFQKDARDYYNLEGIWGDAPVVKAKVS